MPETSEFKFIASDRVGYADAEEDQELLRKCFVSTGQLGLLRKSSSSERIVLGRTGSGKTALLNRLLDEEENSIIIKPEQLALGYLTTDTILSYIVGLEIDLRLFFDLLWRHVFTIEVIQRRYNITSQDSQKSFMERISGLFERDKKKLEALKYLEDWGDTFWQDTEFRIKEFTRTLERKIEASGGVKAHAIMAKIKAGATVTEEEKYEIEKHARSVISRVQMNELGKVIELLDSILADPQNKWFIVIDKLDEPWVEDRFRCQLIRALIDATKAFTKVRQLKIVIALRLDLLDTVLRQTKTSGQQGEKYEDICMQLRWGRAQLVELLDLRIKKLVVSRYTKRAITHKDLLEPVVKGNKNKATIDYIIDRTLMRPRDMIMFFNTCIARATDSPKITNNMLQEAEGQYSRERFESLMEEWAWEYPNMRSFAELFRDKPSEMSPDEIHDEHLRDVCMHFVSKKPAVEDAFSEIATEFISQAIGAEDCRRKILSFLYHVGLVGLRLRKSESPSWSVDGPRSISYSEIRETATVLVHPMFWRRLGIEELRPPKAARRQGQQFDHGEE